MAKKMHRNRKKRTKISRKNVPLIVAGVLVLLVVIIGLLIGLRTVGKAQEVPLPEVDLVAKEAEELNVPAVLAGGIGSTTLRVSNPVSDDSLEYFFVLQENEFEPGQIIYTITGIDSSVIAQGLLSDQAGGGNLYLDTEDVLPDISLQYTEPVLKITNLHFTPPKAVEITAVTPGGVKFLSRFFVQTVGFPLQFLFNATSTVTPELRAYWSNGTQLAEVDFALNASGDGFVTKRLQWAPQTEGAYEIFIEGLLPDGQTTTERYVIAAGGVVSAVTEANLPEVIVKQVKGNTVHVSYTFRNTLNLQPFSLPCGSAAIEGELPEEKIDAVYAYGKGVVKQWRNVVADPLNDFMTLETNQGYLLRKAVKDELLNFTVVCTVPVQEAFPPEFSALFEPPQLAVGWNLIGVSGYDPVDFSVIAGNVPNYAQVATVHQIDNDGAYPAAADLANFQFEPGKAYWVEVASTK